MKRNRIILLNILFFIIFLVFLILSFTFGFYFSFFFLPLFCFLPFSCKSRNRIRALEDNQRHYRTSPQVKICPVCGGVIKKGIAAEFCYNCGAKLKHY